MRPDPAPPVLDQALWFPDPHQAPRAGPVNGLVAFGGDLSVARLLLAYRHGIFPWTDSPITWWSPEPRAVIELDRLHISRSLGKALKAGRFTVTFNRAFRRVVEGCAEPAPGRPSTWISPAFIEAYTRLHQAGHAHSVECWQHGQLVGGVYGVAIGGLFSGESMFHRRSNASKVAVCHLVRHLQSQGFALFDVQTTTPVTAQMGAVAIERASFLARLARAVDLAVAFQAGPAGGRAHRHP
jgi:leucyl/phenylalanyl-tRNA---protein transferase